MMKEPEMDSNDIYNPFYSPEVKDPLDADWAAKRKVAQATRQLIADLVTCTTGADKLLEIADVISRQAARLREEQQLFGRSAYSDAFPEKYTTLATLGYELNPLDGESNPIAAPMKVWIEGDTAYGTANLGWAYEGPPNSIHGGFVAAIFDQFLGVAQKITGQPGVTGTISIRYLKPTPLNTDIKLVGRVKSVEGRKNVLVGEMWAGEVLTATCEGLFVYIDLEAYHRMKDARPG